MANTKRLTEGLPGEVLEMMTALGANLRVARKRRKMSIAALSERLMLSPPTVRKLEKGDPTVSLGVLVSALWVLGLAAEMRTLAAPEKDEVGLRSELQRMAGKHRKVVTEDDFHF